MIQTQQDSYNQFVFEDPASGITVFVKREDVLHHEISGNKFRKLKYNLEQAQVMGHSQLLTFGGAYSNHIAAVAAAGKLLGLKTIGIIRGDELTSTFMSNPTLRKAHQDGMHLEFVSRTDYREKSTPVFLEKMTKKWGAFYLLPEGGTNSLAVKGCEEILTTADQEFDYICCAVGTGGTFSGIVRSLQPHQSALGFSVLKGDFLRKEIKHWVKSEQWQLITDYHFGGYAKKNDKLSTFIATFESKYFIPLEPIYTGKTFFGVIDMISKGFFPKQSKILIIHTGGLQGAPTATY